VGSERSLTAASDHCREKHLHSRTLVSFELEARVLFGGGKGSTRTSSGSWSERCASSHRFHARSGAHGRGRPPASERLGVGAYSRRHPSSFFPFSSSAGVSARVVASPKSSQTMPRILRLNAPPVWVEAEGARRSAAAHRMWPQRGPITAMSPKSRMSEIDRASRDPGLHSTGFASPLRWLLRALRRSAFAATPITY
jgi:hypothetical protein